VNAQRPTPDIQRPARRHAKGRHSPSLSNIQPSIPDVQNLPLGPGVRLIAHDANGLAALDKPAGVLSHPNDRADEPRSLLHARYVRDGEYYEWYYEWISQERGPETGNALPPSPPPPPSSRRLWLLNRLDSATSGAILVCADGDLAREIRALFLRKQIRKVYHALVFGIPSQARQIWRDRLAVQKKGGVIRTGTGGNIPSESHMTVLRQQRSVPFPLALLELEPRTGRSHQLRVQCASRRLPIVGDATYGDFAANRAIAKKHGLKRLCLHSHETAFDYEWRGRTHTFRATAPTPPEFLRLL
jgi:23S rRNA-/tRNA-specific pseudouridylate synthase